MTIQELSVLFFNFFASLKLFQNKELRGGKGKRRLTVRFILPLVNQTILATQLLVWAPARQLFVA